MKYLSFISGPRMGSRVDVGRMFGGKAAPGAAERILVLGRELTVDIPVDDLNISRRHAGLLVRGEKIFLRDLESTNGTFVNGELVKEKGLANGDQISIGDSVIVFEDTDASRFKTSAVTFREARDDRSTAVVRLDPGKSGYLDPAAVRARPESAERLTRLYRFISNIAPVVSPERLAEEVLDRALAAARADRGFIMLVDEAGNLRPEHMRFRDPARQGGSIELSSRMTRQALDSGQSILSSDTLHDRRFKDSLAFSANRVNSFVCAPLKHRDKVIGLLYVDTLGMTKPLDQDDLELITAMALLAGTQFANTRYFAAVADSARYTQSILKCLRSGVIVTDLDLTVRQVNDSACEMLGRREQELVGRSFAEFKTLQPLWSVIQETVTSGIPAERQELVVEIAGENVPLGASTSILRDHENRLRGVVTNFRSLKVIKKLSEQVRMAQHLAALGEMAAGIAHEIRNPLNSIRGFAQLLGEMLPEMVPSEADAEKLASSKGYVDIIVEEVDRMNQLVQDLLDFSRQRELTMVKADVHELLEETLRELAPDLDQASVELERRYPDGGASVVGSGPKLKQVLVNIVRNAIQAMTPPVAPEGGPRRLEVSISTGEAPATVEIAIRDSGAGMDEETGARIFEPFFTTRERGTGLGLPICRKIIQQHSGTIEAESSPGAGTTVRIVLPRRLA